MPVQEILYPLQLFPDPAPVVPPLTVNKIEPVDKLLHATFVSCEVTEIVEEDEKFKFAVS
jgi:hypothetical protein